MHPLVRRGPEGSGPAWSNTRAGFSLVEALIVIVVMGMVMVIAAPRVSSGLARANVDNAVSATGALYSKARITALQLRKPATLRFSGGQVWITVPRGAGLDTVGAVTDLAAEYGVTVASTGNPTILPIGLLAGNTAIQVKFTKGGSKDSLMISGYGRIQ